jgi:oligosaccharide repeat unit polymerase
VSSYFANYLRDLGLVGTIIFVFLVQMVVCLFYNQAYQFKLGGLVAYATLFNSVVMSIFFDYFFSLVTVFQVVLGLAINYILYSKKSPKYVQ